MGDFLDSILARGLFQTGVHLQVLGERSQVLKPVVERREC